MGEHLPLKLGPGITRKQLGQSLAQNRTPA
jgi:hypothetical protein